MKSEEIVTYKRKTDASRNAFISEIASGQMIVSAISALMVSRVGVLGNMAPFGVALYASNLFNDKYYIILSSCILGTLISGGKANKVSHIIALALLLGIKKILPQSVLKKTGVLPVLAAICIIIPCGIFSFFSGTFYYSIITALTESLIAGGMYLVFSKSSFVIRQNFKITSDEESISVAILAGTVVAGFQGISLFGIKAANILSMYIILFTAYKGGIGISGATGAALGIIAGISQGDAPALTGVYGFMGLVSGIMNIFGKTGVVLSSALSNSLFAGYYNSSTIVLVNFFEIAIAGVLFFFTPEKTLNYFGQFSIRSPIYDASGGFVMRLKSTIGEVLASLKNSATAIAEAYSPCHTANQTDSKNLIKERLVARVCDGCSLNKYCWSRNAKGSNMMFEKVSDALFEENFDEVNGHITGRCVRGDTLCHTAKELYGVFKREKIIKSRVDKYARNFSDGWADLLEIIKSKEGKIINMRPDFPVLESELCRVLSAEGIKSPEISIIMNDIGRVEIFLRTKKELLFDIIPPAEKITGRKLCVSDEYKTAGGFVVKLQEKLRFDYDVSILSMNKQGSETSGDSCEWFVTPDGIFYCLLCDGMGSGEVAQNDSRKVINLFKTLILSGFNPESAVKIINGGMISKCEEERCVSFDCMWADLFSGKISFIKAGGVASILKSGKNVSIVRQNSFPLGILDMPSAPPQTFFLKDDTYIVMMSDGITDVSKDRNQGEQCIANILKLMEVSSCKEVSDSIMMSSLSEGMPKDDMMVTAIKISGKDK